MDHDPSLIILNESIMNSSGDPRERGRILTNDDGAALVARIVAPPPRGPAAALRDRRTILPILPRPGLHLGCISAVSRAYLGYTSRSLCVITDSLGIFGHISAVSRPHLGRISANISAIFPRSRATSRRPSAASSTSAGCTTRMRPSARACATCCCVSSNRSG